MQSTSVRIDSATHEELKRLASELQTTVGNTVTLAVRALRQDRVGVQLREPLRDGETEWLDADSGDVVDLERWRWTTPQQRPGRSRSRHGAR